MSSAKKAQDQGKAFLGHEDREVIQRLPGTDMSLAPRLPAEVGDQDTSHNTLILKMLNPHTNQVTNMIYVLVIFLVAALPGYIVAFLTIDRMGRKAIQCVGFGVMALSYALIALVPALSNLTVPFLALYGVGYFFTEWGPNTTTFVYPAEIFPISVRSSAHGIAAGLGKVGAFIGAFAFPYLLIAFHIQGAMAFATVVALIGLFLTLFTLPEPNGRSLEEISGDFEALAVSQKESLWI